MNLRNEFNFMEGRGIPYRYVYHLLWGTRKLKKVSCTRDSELYFHDANLLGYGCGPTDSEIEEINEMELRLGRLSPEVRDLRTMIDFCCIWRYDYPERVHLICSAIGGSGTTMSRCHYQVGTEKREQLSAYVWALKRWLGMREDSHEIALGGNSLRGQTEQRVLTLLGTREELKDLLVERTLWGLSSRPVDCSFWGVDAQRKAVSLIPFFPGSLPSNFRSRMQVLENSIRKMWGETASDFLCEVGGAEPPCHFKFIRRLEILIGSIGCLKWRGYLPPKDSTVSGRREITRQYLTVLCAYWKETETTDGGNPSLKALQKELFTALGEPSLTKKWLVASLWKNIQNQTLYRAFTMKRWVEFVQITRYHLSRCHS